MIFKFPKDKTRRVRRKFAWLPVEVSKGLCQEACTIWLQSYEVVEQYNRNGYSLTGYDYTPRGWQVLTKRLIETTNPEKP